MKVNFCWKICTLKEKVEKKKSNESRRTFCFDFSKHTGICGFCLQGRYMFDEEETANNFLCVASFKHILLKSLEFQRGPGYMFHLQETLFCDDSQDTKVALHRYITMKQGARWYKWRQEKHNSSFYASPFLPHSPEGAVMPSCPLLEKIMVPDLLLPISTTSMWPWRSQHRALL